VHSLRSARLVCAASFALALAALPGCIGLTYVGTATFDDADATGDSPLPPRTRPEAHREEDLLHSLGVPDERELLSETREVWVYDEGWRWNGPVLFVVIPIPLLVPVGSESTTYHLRDGVVERVVRVEQTWDGYMCGLIGHFAGCHSLNE